MNLFGLGLGLFICLSFSSFSLTCGQSPPVTFMAMQFSSTHPYLFELNSPPFALALDLCDSSPYAGCQMTASINLPATSWNIGQANYVNFQVNSEVDNCSRILCQNDIYAANNPNRCTFIYDPKFGTRLYVSGQAAQKTTSLVTTFNLAVNCSHASSSSVQDDDTNPFERSASGCPAQYDPSKRSIVLLSTRTIPTSQAFQDAALYKFAICNSITTFVDLSINVRATDKNSAFSTFVCDQPDCEANFSNFSDTSGSATNRIEATNLKIQTVWLSVFGWGQFQGTNSFLFDTTILDHN